MYTGPNAGTSEDEALARKLQAEEEARSRGSGSGGVIGDSRGAASSYYTQGGGGSLGVPGQQQGQYMQQQQQRPVSPAAPERRGLLSRLTGKSSSQQHYGGGYPQQGYGGYPPQQGYGQPMYAQQQPARRAGGGLGALGGGALGLGGGLLGGMMLEHAIDGNQYQQGYNQGVSLLFFSCSPFASSALSLPSDYTPDYRPGYRATRGWRGESA